MLNFLKTIKNKIVKSKPIITFKCKVHSYHLSNPIVEAKRLIPEWVKIQAKNKNVKFAKCPGMFDLAQQGYIMRAWCDIHIKINRQGIFIKLEREDVQNTLTQHHMDFSVIEGLAPIPDNMPKMVRKLDTPWHIYCKPGYSAQVLPATMHSPFFDKIYVYPGVVDYDGFQTCNFIFSGLKECEFTIWAGTPLLQIIPFKREDITAECGKSTEEDKDIAMASFYSRAPNFYRRMIHKRKNYSIKQI
jgi:hypothetical protein